MTRGISRGMGGTNGSTNWRAGRSICVATNICWPHHDQLVSVLNPMRGGGVHNSTLGDWVRQAQHDAIWKELEGRTKLSPLSITRISEAPNRIQADAARLNQAMT